MIQVHIIILVLPDITRSIIVSDSKEEVKHDYTLVFKGQIDGILSRIHEDYTADVIDIRSRYPFWA